MADSDHQSPALVPTGDGEAIAAPPADRLASLFAKLEDEALGLVGRDPASYDRDSAEARISQLGEEIRAILPASTPTPADEINAQRALASEEIANDVLGWLQERGLYDPRDYEHEGPNVAEILTEHEEELLKPRDPRSAEEVLRDMLAAKANPTPMAPRATGLPFPDTALAFSISNMVLNAIAWGAGTPEALDRPKAMAEAAAEMATKPRRPVDWLSARAALFEIDAAVRAGRRSEQEVS